MKWRRDFFVLFLEPHQLSLFFSLLLPRLDKVSHRPLMMHVFPSSLFTFLSVVSPSIEWHGPSLGISDELRFRLEDVA
jgi:hypothetical protein